jgi:mannosyl-oligosaccharide alpha-1,2-mannosidase
MTAIKEHILYRPMTQGGEDLLFAGKVSSDGNTPLSSLKPEPEAQHLACFAGGMFAIGSKVFGDAEELSIARKLVEGCIWAYETGPMGIMPEIMYTVRCKDQKKCTWDLSAWHEGVRQAFPGDNTSPEERIRANHLSPGVAKVDDARYVLRYEFGSTNNASIMRRTDFVLYRPEAIESVFILYRITGDPSLPDRAWNMFNAIVQNTKTDIAHAGLDDCTVPDGRKTDRMESFWLSETLKYFYLMFSEPDVVSLDKYVFNTEAHPLKIPS